MTKLPKGPLKIIAPIVKNAVANRQRQGAGSKAFKPVWNVYVLDMATQRFTPYTAHTFRASGLTPRSEPRGIKIAYPQAHSAMREALDAGLWFETLSEITLNPTSDALSPEKTKETTDNG